MALIELNELQYKNVVHPICREHQMEGRQSKYELVVFNLHVAHLCDECAQQVAIQAVTDLANEDLIEVIRKINTDL